MLTESYDPLLVALSYVVAAVGSYASLSLAARLTAPTGRLRVSWLLGGMLAQATGIWSMHFTGMLALSLPVAIAFDAPLVALSFAIASAGALFALILTHIRQLAAWKLVAAGILIGAGVAGVHYTDMAAMRMAARIHHDQIWVGISIGVAILSGILGLWLMRRHREDHPRRSFWSRLGAALIMGLGLAGQHYSAMAGVDFSPGPDTRPFSQWLLGALNLPQIVLAATLVILLTALASAWIDRRGAARAALAGRMLAVRENERRGVARVLHADVGQLLTALRVNLQRLHPLQGEAGILADSVGLVDDALTRVRALSLELRPNVLDDVGLAAAVTWYANREAERGGYVVKVVENIARQRIDEAVETAAFRIVQQALTNVTRHANAKNVRVSLRLSPRALDLAISDDGVGFNVGAARIRAEAGESLGLLDMEEMAALAGGSCSVTSAPGKGSAVEVRFQLPED